MREGCNSVFTFAPSLDRYFMPASIEKRNFIDAVNKTGGGARVAISLERSNGLKSRFCTPDLSIDPESYTGGFINC